MTLREETITDIGISGHEIADIIYIGNDKGNQCTWDQFVQMADREYDNGYGSAEVATDLKIVFSDGQMMTRGEYDGSEWWQFTAPFTMPEKVLPINTLFPGRWSGLGGEDE